MQAPSPPILLFGESYHHPNIFYRTGFLAPDPVIVVDRGGNDTVLWVNGMEEGRARKEAHVGRVRCMDELQRRDELKKEAVQDRWFSLVESVCREHGLTAVAVDSDFPALLADELRTRGIDVQPQRDLYTRQRRMKTPDEIAKIETAQSAGMDGLQRAIDVIAQAPIKDGLLRRANGHPLSGADLVIVVETRLLELGCSAEDSVCCGGPESADPHRTVSDVIREGLPIVLDIFPFNKTSRYCGDVSRTVVRGNPPIEVQLMWEAVKEAHRVGIGAVHSGANCRDIYRTVCDVFKERGYASAGKEYRDIPSSAKFVHGAGHGVGLELHEPPYIGNVDDEVEVGDLFMIEPGLYDPQFGGVRIEDMVVVTADGCRNLSATLPTSFRLDD